MHTHMYPQPWRGLVINMQSQFGGNREERVSYYMYPRRRPLLISNHTITYAWCKLWREREKTHMDPAWNSFALIKAYICPWLYTYIVFLMVFVFIPRDWHGTITSDDHWNGRSLISSSKNLKLTAELHVARFHGGILPPTQGFMGVFSLQRKFPLPKHTGSQV